MLINSSQETNTELDMYGCFKALAENKGGCDVSKTLGSLLETSTSVNGDDLCPNVTEIHREVKALAPALRQNGQRIVIVVATDGLPTDECGYGGEVHQKEFVEALRLLEGLPVWVVIRLCTDEERVVNFAEAGNCDVDAFRRFFHLMLERGVYLAPSAFEAGFVSSAHSEEHIEATVSAARESFARL